MIRVFVHALAFVLLAGVPALRSSQCPDTSRAPDATIRQADKTACVMIGRVQPDDPRAYLDLALTAADSTVRAAILEAGLDRFPRDYFLQLNAGLTLRRVGRVEDALHAFEAAAKLEPGDAHPLVEAGLTAATIGQHERAIHYYLQAAKRRGVEPEAWGYLARSEHALGRHADAVRHWDRAEEESRYRYLDESGDRLGYDTSLALAPGAHIAPSQLGPTIRAVVLLLVPIGLLAFVVWLVLGGGKAGEPVSLWRIFTAVTVLHFGLAEVLLVAVVGLSFGAWNHYPSLPLDRLILAAAGLLSMPLQSPILPLPPVMRVNPPLMLKLLNSMVWASAVTALTLWWRRRTAAPPFRSRRSPK